MLFLKIQLFPPPTLSVSARRKKFQSKNRKENPIDMINVLLRRITIEQNLKNKPIWKRLWAKSQKGCYKLCKNLLE